MLNNEHIAELFNIKDRVIIVTGASRGIGKELAQSLSSFGAKVIGTSRSTPDFDYSFTHIKLDLNDSQSIGDFVSELEGSFGKCDALINCAGITIPTVEEDNNKNLESFKNTWLTNTYAPYQLATLLTPLLKKGSLKSIINVTSIGAMTGFPGNPGYVSSKYGLRGLTASLANDLGTDGIRVNNLVPGYFRTEMTRKSYQDEDLKKKRDDRILLGRWGEVSDLVGPTLFLLSNASSYVTGTDIIVDGGWLNKGITK